jgi:hypothetical protein
VAGLKKSMAHRIDYYKVFPDMFPYNIMPCDLDGILGINDKFIVMEWKTATEGFKKGQLILLKSLARQPNFSVLLIIGEANPDKQWVNAVYRYNKKEDKFKKAGEGMEYLRAVMKKWFDNAWGKSNTNKETKEL